MIIAIVKIIAMISDIMCWSIIMRTKRATAPDALLRILSAPVRGFTISDVAQLVGLSYAEAKAAVVYGVQEDRLRILRHRQNGTDPMAVYENPRWRRQWITQPWRESKREELWQEERPPS
jgi:hypothetical protein